MSNPLVTNRIPTSREVAGVADPVRFSLRDLDLEILRSGTDMYLGAGPSFYPGGELPENLPELGFVFGALSGTPGNPAIRTIELDGSLRIEKASASTNQEAIYRFGGLRSPMAPDGPLMLEWTLSLAQADVVVDGNDFTGVVIGVKINDGGFAVKYYTDGATRRIEIHDAGFSTIAPPSGTYSAVFDWDAAGETTYKVLWFPETDTLKLYISSGADDTPDTVLIDGAVSDFGVIPEGERPLNEPEAYFGHGFPVPTSISYWHDVFLYNIVTNPLAGGIAKGEHVGFFKTNAVMRYDPVALPKKSDLAWLGLPSSFDPRGGTPFLESGVLVLRRTVLTESLGFYRVEPKVSNSPTILDFRIYGTLENLPSGQTTGMEFYIDDGVQHTRVALLFSGATQSVGMLIGSPATSAASYIVQTTSWGIPKDFRIIYDPSGDVTFVELVDTDEGKGEQVVGIVAAAALPATTFPGPGLGFLHNGLVTQAQATMFVGAIRYSTNARLLSGTVTPPGAWSTEGTGTIDTNGSVLVVDDVNDNDILALRRTEATLGTDNGFFCEYRGKVISYEVDGVSDPIRNLTGAGIDIDDGTSRTMLLFADAGPPNGMIAFIPTEDDFEANLEKIRAGDESVEGTYFSTDWTDFHMYRIEREVGGLLQVFVDNADEPVISFANGALLLPNTAGSGARVGFGSLIDTIKSNSQWAYFRHNVSDGFNASIFPDISEETVLSRFDHAVNTIVETEDTA